MRTKVRRGVRSVRSTALSLWFDARMTGPKHGASFTARAGTRNAGLIRELKKMPKLGDAGAYAPITATKLQETGGYIMRTAVREQQTQMFAGQIAVGCMLLSQMLLLEAAQWSCSGSSGFPTDSPVRLTAEVVCA
jgi:hypothetical protein